MQKPKSIPSRSDCYYKRLKGGVVVGCQQWETYCNEYSLMATKMECWMRTRERDIYIYKHTDQSEVGRG